MTSSLFDDAWQSLEWANSEAEALKAEIDDFRDGKPYPVVAESYPDNSGGEITLTILKLPDLVLWASSGRAAAAISLPISALHLITPLIRSRLLTVPVKPIGLSFQYSTTLGRSSRTTG